MNQSRCILAVVLLGITGCGITASRTHETLTLNEVIYDDRCGLADYFDRMAFGSVNPPTVVRTQEMEKIEGKRAQGGITRYAFSSDGQLRALRQMLAQNYRRLPETVNDASQMDLTVRWSKRAENQFVVMNEAAQLHIGKENHTLPYHHCLSALLFGENLYESRRQMLNLPDPRPKAATPKPLPTESAP